ncbi:MAG: hypothetical protein LBE24_02715 [Methylobacillus sp.]|jgi:hypothetical protein|nr:hypothetical protein [Methylobacillus sp.]
MKHSNLLLSAILLTASISALAQNDPAVDGTKKPVETVTDEKGLSAQVDTSGHGAVLCSWAIYVEVQAITAACQKPRKPADDAIDAAIVDIDKFIIANSSERPTQANLDEFKHRVTGTASPEQIKEYCAQPDDPIINEIRSMSPDKIREQVKHLLAVPREPVMNPCL